MPPPVPPVRLTRRTSRFAELATAVEERLASVGVSVDPAGVDESLRGRIRGVGEQLGVSDRTALGNAPDDVADSIAHELLIAACARAAQLGLDATAPSAPPVRHLRVVR
ncbi:hypothetical protein [Nocardioides gansuensis]|uniref:hypothetical protein n=1 Tax=Nocardioides gansuensis TaxID=2138300 RepID=UPI001057F940|nr:hypothetical protein [Nocardioides gansuensis]